MSTRIGQIGRIGRAWVAVGILGVLCCGCAGKSVWYHPDKSAQDFGPDSSYCHKVATTAARMRTVSGEQPDPAALTKAYALCLESLGWREAKGEYNGSVPVLSGPEVTSTNGGVSAWGQTMPVFPGLNLATQISDNQAGLGQTVLVFTGNAPQAGYVQMIFQQSSSDFDRRSFPVPQPFFLYDQGQTAKERTQWAFFAGPYQKAWTGGVGAYLLLPDRHKRIVVVATWNLPAQDVAPPKGLRLSLEQKKAMDRGLKRWEPWLRTMSRKLGAGK